jgi:hypothetical protein
MEDGFAGVISIHEDNDIGALIFTFCSSKAAGKAFFVIKKGLPKESKIYWPSKADASLIK